MEPPVAIVPVKALDGAKSRLAGALAPELRTALVLDLLARVVGAARGAGLAVTVVSPDPRVHDAARALGADALDDGGAQLAAADPLAVAAAPDGTTHGVAARPPSAFVPSYGPGSAARHGGTPVDLPGLRRDVDVPADLPAGCVA